jgi:hypothetical protein
MSTIFKRILMLRMALSRSLRPEVQVQIWPYSDAYSTLRPPIASANQANPQLLQTVLMI